MADHARPDFSPDFADVMQDWLAQYLGKVYLDYTYEDYMNPLMCVSVEGYGKVRQVVGFFDDNFRIHIVDKDKNETGQILRPEDPMFFEKLDDHIRRTYYLSHPNARHGK